MMQGSFIMSNFFTDQLEAEQERDELVVQGKLTNEQAEKDNSEWEEVRNFKEIQPVFFELFECVLCE